MTAPSLETRLYKLDRISLALSSETKLDKLMDLIVMEAREFTRAESGCLYLRSNDLLQLRSVHSDARTCETGRKTDGQHLPLTRTSPAGYAALTGKILNIEDLRLLDGSAEFSFKLDSGCGCHNRTRSMLVVPLREQNGENIGVIELINALDDRGEVVSFPAEIEPLVLSLAAHAAVAVRNAQILASTKNVFGALVKYSASAIDARSPHTAGHSRRVAALSLLMAEAINRSRTGVFADVYFNEDALEELSYAAWLHDIGKIGVSEKLLEKTFKLDEARMDLIRERFSRAALTFQLEYQERILDLYRQGKPVLEEILALESERDRRLEELKQDFDFLLRLNYPQIVTEEDLDHLKVISNKNFTDRDGKSHNYLEEYEFAHLSVNNGNLTQQEYEEVQSHVGHTQNIVEKIPFTPELARIPVFAATHHEMLDGSGYPQGLAGEDIPLQARILGVADIFDALAAGDRPYKKALPVEKALAVLKEEAARGRLDKDVVDLFIEERIGYNEAATAQRQAGRRGPNLSS